MTRFDPQDRARLLVLPQIGPQVIERLEAAGIDRVVAAVCRQLGNRAWENRRRALLRAFDA